MTVPSTASRRQLVVLGLAAALAVAGCAAPTTASTAPGRATVPPGTSVDIEPGIDPAAPSGVTVTSGPAVGGDAGSAMIAWDPVIIDASVPVGPENVCGGVDQTTTDFTRLGADDRVGEIIVCGAGLGYLPGDGIWNLVSEHRVPAAQLPALVDGLRRPDVVAPPDTACTMILVMVPTFTVVTEDGRRLKGSVPSDGCHPQEDVVGPITQVLAEQPAEQQWRTTLTQPESALTTSCAPETYSAWPPVDVTDGNTDVTTPAPSITLPVEVPTDTAADGAEICLYPAPAAAAPLPATGAVDEPAASTEPGSDDPVTVPGSPPLPATPLIGSGRIDADLRDRLMGSIVTTTPADRPGCTAADPWTSAPDGSGQLLLATPPTRTPTGVPQPGYPYLTVETGSCGRVLVDGGYTFVGWADPETIAEARVAVGS